MFSLSTASHKYTNQCPDVVLCNFPSNPTQKLVNIFVGVARHEEVHFHLQQKTDTHCMSLIGIHVLSEIILGRTLFKNGCLHEHTFHAEH